jgi:60 kDa SS-A/Ro ribonucleoprotein
MEQFRGWGRLAREAVAGWYNDMPADKLAYQVIKYQQRDGWEHRDLLRLAHPTAIDDDHATIYRYITSDYDSIEMKDKGRLWVINGFEGAKTTTDKASMITIIENSGLTREMIPTEWLKDPDIWAALLKKMPMTAMVRNLGNMGKVGLLIPGNLDAIESVCSKLSDKDVIKRSRIHPLNVLSALNIYASGQGFRGSGTWQPVGNVIDALNDAFYTSFDNVEPSGKRICIGLDVSGSMNDGQINGIPGMTPRVGAAAMCMVTYKTEPKVSVMAFAHEFIPINMSRHRRLDDLVKYTNSLRFGGTDCALPMLWAMEQYKVNPSVVYDAFVIYTDNETWAGSIHPIQALNQYRRQVNPDARLVIVGMTANDVTIGDPQDAGVLDVVGFDTAAPGLISEFIGGKL